jgi:kynurenine 3-monooxygenase
MKRGVHHSVEMRHAVTTPAYLIRKRLDNFLSAVSADAPTLPSTSPARSEPPPALTFDARPRGWLPLYTMVTFRPDISYATAKKKAEAQGRVLSCVGSALTAVASVGGALALLAGAFSVGKSLKRTG